jgi:hypothetical protein
MKIENYLVLYFALIASTSQAAVIVTTNNSDTTASSTDLLQTAFSSQSTTGNITLDTTDLRDGTAFALGSQYNWGGGNIRNGSTLTYTFDTVASPGGYVINEINFFTGWRGTNGDRHQMTNFNVAYATVALPLDFSNVIITGGSGGLFTQNFLDGGSTTGRYGVVDNGSAALATGVAAIRISFVNVQNGAIGMSEIDILGTAIPEPSSAALLGGLGMLALLRRRR